MAKPPPRLFVEDDLARGEAITLDQAQAHYLGTVLRHRTGAPVLVFNGRDGEWSAELAEISRKGAALILGDQRRKQVGLPDLTLLFAPLKKGPTDLIIQKGTELGVRCFQPVATARTVAGRVATERLATIAREAAEQSERLDIPVVAELLPLDEALSKLGEGRILFCDEAGDDPDARWGGGSGLGVPALQVLPREERDVPWAVLIGPEGGFTPEERDSLRADPRSVAVSLGPRILKAETAAFAALTLWQATLGDL